MMEMKIPFEHCTKERGKHSRNVGVSHAAGQMGTIDLFDSKSGPSATQRLSETVRKCRVLGAMRKQANIQMYCQCKAKSPLISPKQWEADLLTKRLTTWAT